MQHGRLVRHQRNFCRLPIPGTESIVSMIARSVSDLLSTGIIILSTSNNSVYYYDYHRRWEVLFC